MLRQVLVAERVNLPDVKCLNMLTGNLPLLNRHQQGTRERGARGEQ